MAGDVWPRDERCHQKDVIQYSTCSLPSVGSWIWEEQASNYYVAVLVVVSFLRFLFLGTAGYSEPDDCVPEDVNFCDLRTRIPTKMSEVHTSSGKLVEVWI